MAIDNLTPLRDQLLRAEELIEELVAENEALREALVRSADEQHYAVA